MNHSPIGKRSTRIDENLICDANTNEVTAYISAITTNPLNKNENDNTLKDIELQALVYYQKPVVGNSNNKNKNLAPVQIIYPSGGFGLGIPVIDIDANNNENANTREQTCGVIASAPEFTDFDKYHLKVLKFTFLSLAIANIVITCLMYTNATTVDPSKVEDITYGGLPVVFQDVSRNRNKTEKANFACLIIILLIGFFSVLFEFTLGISTYCFAICLNFILGFVTVPYFVYSFRYIFDVFMLYIALVIRSRLVVTFLPLYTPHVHRQ